ncbi:Cuticlin, partial [Operophtera brumata]
DARFNGIVYPAGLGSNSSCLREYVSRRGDLQYSPHLKLVTGQGRGYHVRCKYRRRDLSQFHVYPKAARLTSADTNKWRQRCS